MTTYNIEYIVTGSGETKRTDRVSISEGEEFEFESGKLIITNIMDAIEAFEIIAAKWWGTYETKNSITKITTTTI